MRYLLLTIFSLGSTISLFAQTTNFESVTYYQDDTLTLTLNLFLPSQPKDKNPLLIYVHGGGFAGGNRTEGHKLARFLQENGIATASISYTLRAKGQGFSCDVPLPEKVKIVQIAVSHTWLATDFLLRNSEKYRFDQSAFFLAGSSAGAETVLHAAYFDRKKFHVYEQTIPDGFRYAGVISGAGAIMDLNPITEESMIPTMLFHGTADPLVPYATAAHHYCKPDQPGWWMLFGSYSIYEHISDLGGTVHMSTFCNGGHKYAGYSFNNEQELVLEFLKRVGDGEKFSEHRISTNEEGAASYQFCK